MQNITTLWMAFLQWEVRVPDVPSYIMCYQCGSLLSVPLEPLQHHSQGTTVHPLPILSCTGHMSLERIYDTISLLKKNCKEAGEDDKAVQVKKASLKDKPPIGSKGLAAALHITSK